MPALIVIVLIPVGDVLIFLPTMQQTCYVMLFLLAFLFSFLSVLLLFLRS